VRSTVFHPSLLCGIILRYLWRHIILTKISKTLCVPNTSRTLSSLHSTRPKWILFRNMVAEHICQSSRFNIQQLNKTHYCTISINSARGVTCDALAEIFTPAKSRVDKGQGQISARGNVRPPMPGTMQAHQWPRICGAARP